MEEQGWGRTLNIRNYSKYIHLYTHMSINNKQKVAFFRPSDLVTGISRFKGFFLLHRQYESMHQA